MDIDRKEFAARMRVSAERDQCWELAKGHFRDYEEAAAILGPLAVNVVICRAVEALHLVCGELIWRGTQGGET